jgi:hypothetical protein
MVVVKECGREVQGTSSFYYNSQEWLVYVHSLLDIEELAQLSHS